MKYLSIIIAVFLMAGLLLAPIPSNPPHLGAYSYTSHLMYCKTDVVCLHEIAHRLDQAGGYPSQSKDFKQMLQMYLIVELRYGERLDYVPLAVLDLSYREDNLQEIYAWMFAWAEGKQENMPDGLQPFYDWDKADTLVSLLKDEQRVYWLK